MEVNVKVVDMASVKVEESGRHRIFTIDRTRISGVLRFPHETTIYYDPETGRWSGDDICADGWRDLDEAEVMEIMSELFDGHFGDGTFEIDMDIVDKFYTDTAIRYVAKDKSGNVYMFEVKADD